MAACECERRMELLGLLRDEQAKNGYVSKEAIVCIASELGVPASDVFGVASFFNQFRLEPPGRHSVRVCTGTACHARGSSLVLAEWERELGVKAGTTTADGEFDLDEVACIGCCNLACAVVVDGEVKGEFKSADVKAAVRLMRLRDEERTKAAAAGAEVAR